MEYDVKIAGNFLKKWHDRSLVWLDSDGRCCTPEVLFDAATKSQNISNSMIPINFRYHLFWCFSFYFPSFPKKIREALAL